MGLPSLLTVCGLRNMPEREEGDSDPGDRCRVAGSPVPADSSHEALLSVLLLRWALPRALVLCWPEKV